MGITFQRKNNYDGTDITGGFIYENGPENIGANLLDTSAYGRVFTNVKLEVGRVYEAEYYNWNYASTGIRVGIGIHNLDKSSTGKITILKTAAQCGYKTDSTPSMHYGSEMTLAFMRSSTNTAVTIPINNSSGTQGFKSLLNSPMAHGQLANGRVRFRVDSGNSLYCKIFAVKNVTGWEKFAGWCNLVSATDLSKIDPGDTNHPKPYNYATSATGHYPTVHIYGPVYDTNEHTICFADDATTGVKDAENANEFETATTHLPYTKNGNKGNYGVVYTFYCTQPNVRKAILKPKQGTPTKPAIYTVKEDGVWTNKPVPSDGSCEVKLTNGKSFWFVLGGGNYGKVSLQFTT